MDRIFIIGILVMNLSFAKAQENLTTESINKLSFRLFEQFDSKKENTFYSPLSIYSAVSMIYAGSEDSTKIEIAQFLGLPKENNIHQELKKIVDASAIERELTLLNSNSIWLQKKIKVEKDYLTLLEQYYSAKVSNVNFKDEKDREKARIEINDLVKTQTNGNILDLIPKGILDESTVMILINAVYFNAIWNTEFLPEKTEKDKFYTLTGDSVPCMLMNTRIVLNYYEDEQMQVVEIPYQNNKASMLVFLPKEDQQTDFNNFNFNYLSKVQSSFKHRDVIISLPKFKIETNYELGEYFKKMGMNSAFATTADFSGITKSKNLIIDKILHKSVLEVSEKGTEAASSTAIISMRSTKIGNQEPVNFKANRPFYFIINEKPRNLILFMGYLARPD